MAVARFIQDFLIEWYTSDNCWKLAFVEKSPVHAYQNCETTSYSNRIHLMAYKEREYLYNRWIDSLNVGSMEISIAFTSSSISFLTFQIQTLFEILWMHIIFVTFRLAYKPESITVWNWNSVITHYRVMLTSPNR